MEVCWFETNARFLNLLRKYANKRVVVIGYPRVELVQRTYYGYPIGWPINPRDVPKQIERMLKDEPSRDVIWSEKCEIIPAADVFIWFRPKNMGIWRFISLLLQRPTTARCIVISEDYWYMQQEVFATSSGAWEII